MIQKSRWVVELNLSNPIATTIRFADRADLNESHRVHDIQGIVLIDEIEAHSDL